MPGEISCRTSPDEPPDQWAGWLFPGVVFMDLWEPEVLAIVPAPGKDNSITGNFDGLTLADAVTPHLRATVVCPTDPKKCKIKGNIRVERKMETIVGIEDFVVEPGKHADIDIDLSLYPELLDGAAFTVVLVVTTTSNDASDRGLWLYPRIVEVTG